MNNPSLRQLEQHDDFLFRHIGPNQDEISEMLADLGLQSLEELVGKAIPNDILTERALRLPNSKNETEVLSRIRQLASRNKIYKSYIGMGYYNCITPPVILRNVLENPAWYTAYTPYQAEISQGRLEGLLNFQTLVTDLTGMEIANASLLDEATAAAEAMAMCQNLQKKKKKGCNGFWAMESCFPQTLEVLETRAAPMGIQLKTGSLEDGPPLDEVFGILLQYPDAKGRIHDFRHLIEEAHRQDVLVVVATDLLSLVLLESPGRLGADMVVGSAQRFGVPMGFGGPHAAFFATREQFKRSIPGRIVGMSVDVKGRPALRLALQTREQHIRREKATSNICTSQVLLAVISGMYAVYHGPHELGRIARRVHRLACILARGLSRLGHEIGSDTFFDTITVKPKGFSMADIKTRALEQGINFRYFNHSEIGISLDETTLSEDVIAIMNLLDPDENLSFTIADLDAEVGDQLGEGLARRDPILTHEVFNTHHSETEMLRYLTRLAAKDLSLVHSMIPLGSCTMKLNASAEMMPITWPELNQIHPFAPEDQVRGYSTLIAELERQLCEITGFPGVSLQPNAGSQGEYSGLLAIRKYHEGRGEPTRYICLIPSSAHGTNPASAVMAGFKVEVIKCDSDGNIDISDLRGKAEKYRDSLAALMITYPSTHGVFEQGIREICRIIHDNGGQVYMDGANMNALVGLCRPGEFGPDVIHLNLHKTFCIPHGGGGPGVGPICVAEHLKPWLPGHRQRSDAFPPGQATAVSAAPWGSACILPISWAYISLMGGDGLKKASQVAILSANYIATRLEPHYSVLYKGLNGLVAHECIIDVRPFKAGASIEVEDIAKRLMDYGFHAPTMSWPVAGTLMIEPTESESKEEIDRFCDTMIHIRKEIRAIEEGRMEALQSPLKNAPHTTADLVAAQWDRPYSREQAVYPLPWLVDNKFWPAVSRIDNAYGDKNLVCSCPSIESYRDED